MSTPSREHKDKPIGSPKKKPTGTLAPGGPRVTRSGPPTASSPARAKSAGGKTIHRASAGLPPHHGEPQVSGRRPQTLPKGSGSTPAESDMGGRGATKGHPAPVRTAHVTFTPSPYPDIVDEVAGIVLPDDCDELAQLHQLVEKKLDEIRANMGDSKFDVYLNEKLPGEDRPNLGRKFSFKNLGEMTSSLHAIEMKVKQQQDEISKLRNSLRPSAPVIEHTSPPHCGPALSPPHDKRHESDTGSNDGEATHLSCSPKPNFNNVRPTKGTPEPETKAPEPKRLELVRAESFDDIRPGSPDPKEYRDIRSPRGSAFSTLSRSSSTGVAFSPRPDV